MANARTKGRHFPTGRFVLICFNPIFGKIFIVIVMSVLLSLRCSVRATHGGANGLGRLGKGNGRGGKERYRFSPAESAPPRRTIEEVLDERRLPCAFGLLPKRERGPS
jgi:hypothetical protein